MPSPLPPSTQQAQIQQQPHANSLLSHTPAMYATSNDTQMGTSAHDHSQLIHRPPAYGPNAFNGSSVPAPQTFPMQSHFQSNQYQPYPNYY